MKRELLATNSNPEIIDLVDEKRFQLLKINRKSQMNYSTRKKRG